MENLLYTFYPRAVAATLGLHAPEHKTGDKTVQFCNPEICQSISQRQNYVPAGIAFKRKMEELGNPSNQAVKPASADLTLAKACMRAASCH
jgi:hypothetical protein